MSPKWDLEVDFISLGSGIGGLTAAIVARDQGLDTVVLEKAGKLGGTSAYSLGEVWVPNNHLEAACGLSDSREETLKYMGFLSGGYADPHLLSLLIDTAPVACRYLSDKAGVRWKIIKTFSDYHYPTAPGTVSEGRFLEVEPIQGSELGSWAEKTRRSPAQPDGITHDEIFGWGGLAAFSNWDFTLLSERLRQDYRTLGPGLMAYLVKAAVIDRQIPVFLNTPARRLVVEAGAVVGVCAERDGREFAVRARRGVLMAIGGYDWNPELAKYYEHVPEWYAMTPPQVEGDNFTMGGEIGAAVAALPPWNLAVLLGFRLPGEEHDGKPLWRGGMMAGLPHAIMVNVQGKRFADESFYRDYQPRWRQWDGKTQTHPNYPVFVIFDRTFQQNYPVGSIAPGDPLPEEVVKRGNTLRELAQQLGIDAAGLEATVARFNQFAAQGTDPDFERGSMPWARAFTGDSRVTPNPNLAPLDTPPFFGIRQVPVGMGITAAGLKTNDHAQVVHVRGHAIHGLYAAGNSAAYLDVGAGYQSGMSNCRGMTWGYIAALHAAGR